MAHTERVYGKEKKSYVKNAWTAPHDLARTWLKVLMLTFPYEYVNSYKCSAEIWNTHRNE